MIESRIRSISGAIDFQIRSAWAALKAVFANFRQWLQVVVLNARNSATQMQSLTEYATYHDAFDAARALFFFSITWGFE